VSLTSFQPQRKPKPPNGPSPAGQLSTPRVSRVGRCPHWSFAHNSSRLFLLNCFFGALVQELCHCGHKLLSRPWDPGLGLLPMTRQAQPVPPQGLSPQAQCRSRATWPPRLSHHWTACPIAALSRPPGSSRSLAPLTPQPPLIADRARRIRETSQSRPSGNDPCYATHEDTCGVSCLSSP